MGFLVSWRYAYFWIPLFFIGGLILNIGGIPLLDVDEGAFSEATREMLSSGNWSATYLDGQPRYDKPILTYWFQGIMVSLFGLSEWVLRLHSLISGMLWATGIYFFTKEFINRQTAFAAVIMFASTLMIMVISRAAIADALLNLFIAMCFFDMYRYQQNPQRKYMLRTWLWISLGLLTKGPVAAGIPLIVSGLWFLSLKDIKHWARAIFNPLGWLVMVAVLTPWLWFLWQDQGAGFFKGFLIDHNLNRFADTKEGHGGYWYYYLLALPLVLLPYSGLLVIFRHSKALWQRPFERLLLLWFTVVLVLVSVSSTQLPHYVLYGVTPLIILFAKYRRLWRGMHWVWLFPLSFFALQMVLVLNAENMTDWDNNLYISEMLARAPVYLNTGYLVATVLSIIAIIALAFATLSLWKRLALAGLIQALFINMLFLPAIAGLQQVPIKEAAQHAKKLEATVVAYKIHMPSFSLYREAVTERRETQPGDYVFTRADRIPALAQRFPNHDIQALYAKGGIRLLHIQETAEP